MRPLRAACLFANPPESPLHLRTCCGNAALGGDIALGPTLPGSRVDVGASGHGWCPRSDPASRTRGNPVLGRTTDHSSEKPVAAQFLRYAMQAFAKSMPASLAARVIAQPHLGSRSSPDATRSSGDHDPAIEAMRGAREQRRHGNRLRGGSAAQPALRMRTGTRRHHAEGSQDKGRCASSHRCETGIPRQPIAEILPSPRACRHAMQASFFEENFKLVCEKVTHRM